MILKDSKPIRKLAKKFFNLLFLVQIDGFSLFPDLVPGEIYLASRLPRIKKDDYIIFIFEEQVLIKKVLNRGKNYILTIDNFGKKFFVPENQILGKIFLKL